MIIDGVVHYGPHITWTQRKLLKAPPWCSQAILLGPFCPADDRPSAAQASQGKRWKRSKFQVQRRAQGLPTEPCALQAVALPVNALRNRAATLVVKLSAGMFYSEFAQAWVADFPADANRQCGVDLLETSAFSHVSRDGNTIMLNYLRSYALGAIQELRVKSLLNGGGGQRLSKCAWRLALGAWA